MSTKGREVAKAFLPFHRTNVLVLSGFPQKSLAIKVLKKSILVFHLGRIGGPGRFWGFEDSLGSRDGMRKAEEPRRICGD